MSQYENATVTRKSVRTQEDGGELLLQLVTGTGPAEGHRCIHRVLTDQAGRLKSDIVYFYDPSVSEGVVDRDFELLGSPGLMSVSQLHHTASMLNRGAKVAR